MADKRHCKGAVCTCHSRGRGGATSWPLIGAVAKGASPPVSHAQLLVPRGVRHIAGIPHTSHFRACIAQNNLSFVGGRACDEHCVKTG